MSRTPYEDHRQEGQDMEPSRDQQTPVVNTEKKHGFSTGAGIAILALVIFILGWATLWALTYEPPAEGEKVDDWTLIFEFCMIFVPMLMAGIKIGEIIDDQRSD